MCQGEFSLVLSEVPVGLQVVERTMHSTSIIFMVAVTQLINADKTSLGGSLVQVTYKF